MKTFNILEAKSADWQEGYDAAIEAIREAIKAGKDPNDISGDPDSGNGGQSGDSGDQNGQGQSDSGSRGSGSQGVVRPEDCAGPSELRDIPSTPGGMMDRATGDKLAEQEGYEKGSGSDAAVEKQWEDHAKRAASKMAGKGAGYEKFAGKLAGIYKSKKDWKKELRKIIGTSLSSSDTRQAYANKNVLVSQDRIARTDKDKYDNLDYIMVCLDTSGSFFGDDDYVRQSLTEIAQIAYAKKPLRIFIVYWDTRVAAIDEYHSADELIKDIKKGKVEPKGGGGTDPRCIWDLIKNNKKFSRMRPELTVIFTDGYFSPTPKRDSRRMQNLIWVIMDNPTWTAIPDSNTKTLHISLNK